YPTPVVLDKYSPKISTPQYIFVCRVCRVCMFVGFLVVYRVLGFNDELVEKNTGGYLFWGSTYPTPVVLNKYSPKISTPQYIFVCRVCRVCMFVGFLVVYRVLGFNDELVEKNANV
uniref:hypothetical protein n=1 Tax=Klebsiella pneumoniae TaxID=573 RepID=UPI003EBE923F